MNKQQAIEVLKAHNEWRRGNNCDLETPLPMQNPKDIGEAIDVAIAALSDETVTLPDGWVSVEDAKPKYIENKDYSQNVIGITKSGYMGIFSLIYIDNGESDSGWAWAKANSVFSDIRKTECEFDDDYEVTHWMPLPAAPTCEKKKG